LEIKPSTQGVRQGSQGLQVQGARQVLRGSKGAAGLAELAGFPGVKDSQRLEADPYVGELVASRCGPAAGIGDAARVGT
jgi:hypothetical protein